MTKGEIITDPKETFYRRAWRGDKRYIDRKTGNFTSRAFVPRPKDEEQLSVDLARLTNPKTAVADRDKFAISEILNADVQKLGLTSIYDPVPGNGVPENKAHCLICCIAKEDEAIAGVLARKSKRIYLDDMS